MDEALANQLSRQIKILNRWLKFLVLLFLVWFIVLGALVFKVASYAHTANNKINKLEQKATQGVNAQQKLCSSQAIRTYLQDDTSGVCN
jgi:cell division protein FtsL